MSEFPSNKTEALTMLYLSKQDLSNVSPEELAAMYVEIHDKIAPAFKQYVRIGSKRDLGL